MRQYISQEAMEETLKTLDTRMDKEEHKKEIERIKRARESEKSIEYRAKPKKHVLWSDGNDHKTFQNTHGCWPISREK